MWLARQRVCVLTYLQQNNENYHTHAHTINKNFTTINTLAIILIIVGGDDVWLLTCEIIYLLELNKLCGRISMDEKHCSSPSTCNRLVFKEYIRQLANAVHLLLSHISLQWCYRCVTVGTCLFNYQIGIFMNLSFNC